MGQSSFQSIDYINAGYANRYYLHVFNGFSEEDVFSIDVANPCDVRREAVKHAADRLFNRTGSCNAPADWQLDVCDAQGEMLFRLTYPASLLEY